MARSLFRGAPELSRLFIESPIELLSEFLSHSQFAMFLEEAIAAVPADGNEQARRDAMAAVLKNMKADRTHLIEIEARRVMSMTDNIPETMLRRLGEETQFGAREGLKAQRDAVARSMWAYLNADSLFETSRPRH